MKRVARLLFAFAAALEDQATARFLTLTASPVQTIELRRKLPLGNIDRIASGHPASADLDGCLN
jgi:hypothetical protein